MYIFVQSNSSFFFILEWLYILLNVHFTYTHSCLDVHVCSIQFFIFFFIFEWLYILLNVPFIYPFMFRFTYLFNPILSFFHCWIIGRILHVCRIFIFFSCHSLCGCIFVLKSESLWGVHLVMYIYNIYTFCL